MSIYDVINHRVNLGDLAWAVHSHGDPIVRKLLLGPEIHRLATGPWLPPLSKSRCGDSSKMQRGRSRRTQLSTVADLNPVTYLLEGLRSLVSSGWDASALAQAVAAIAIVGAVSLSMCLAALRGRVARG